jgi:siroheme synthase-like protein
MPRFPLFIDLSGKTCVVIGGGEVAERRVRTLLDFGAALTVIAPDFCGGILALSDIRLIKRPYAGADDLSGAALVLAASNDRELNRRAASDAAALGIAVNAADDPAACTFYFPAIVRRGDVVAGLSSSGSAPSLTARLRKELDELWPDSLAAEAVALKAERKQL